MRREFPHRNEFARTEAVIEQAGVLLIEGSDSLTVIPSKSDRIRAVMSVK
jgi:hypothetical protein